MKIEKFDNDAKSVEEFFESEFSYFYFKQNCDYLKKLLKPNFFPLRRVYVAT